MVYLVKRFNSWFDAIKEPNRFVVFLLLVALPFSVGLYAVQRGPWLPVEFAWVLVVPFVLFLCRIAPKLFPGKF